jgi:hypothetical protein
MFLLKSAILLSILLIITFFGLQISWLKHTSTTSKKLFDDAQTQKREVDLSQIQTLPAIVQKYFTMALGKKKEIIDKAYIAQEGLFRIELEKEEYLHTEAQQFFTTKPKGFTWHAKISMDAGVYVNVFDSYVDSKAAMKAKFLSVYTIVDEYDKKELDQGALQRYLAEALWLPTALLPSQGIVWESIDAHKAKASLKDGNTSVSLEFTFNEKGEIESIYSADRFRELDGAYVKTPWICRLSEYTQKDGYTIPLKGEVAWIIEGVESTYYKLDIKDVKYN